MGNETQHGVVISSKEIYSQMQQVASLLHRIETRIEAMEKRLYEEIDESKEAHDLARNAHKLAENASDKADNALEQIKEMKRNQQWLRNTLIITIVGAAAAFGFAMLERSIGG